MNGIRIATLIAAVVGTGLVAGVFYAYAISVMPALRQTDDRVVLDVMQRINVVIINPWFLVAFIGTIGFTGLAALLHLGSEYRAVLGWIAIGLALNVFAFAVTIALNVPLNNVLDAAGDVNSIADPAALRAEYESPWVRWNVLRAVLHTAAFTVLCGALFVAGIRHAQRG
ncbi:DUF1772 domain-containing protein [Nocardia asteroides]|uniref:anthrone oxygenase family protein n=1 Tax=Nocardia asteroides TaxID=1824 RepID=UPI001E5E480F|nr:anthrone oxygenase family protein [Nocardia asteroides]UGT59595.1 DUF1772 domain-containing protein [Nocardia asteroides]